MVANNVPPTLVASTKTAHKQIQQHSTKDESSQQDSYQHPSPLSPIHNLNLHIQIPPTPKHHQHPNPPPPQHLPMLS